MEDENSDSRYDFRGIPYPPQRNRVQSYHPCGSSKCCARVLRKIQAAAAGTATVQAAGWIEAEPYKSYVTAQADGIVREVLVLEGDTLKAVKLLHG